MRKYNDFLKSKSIIHVMDGIKPSGINQKLFPFQRDIVRWSLQLGRAAIFADCGMGKTFMQLGWAKQIPGPVIIFCPLQIQVIQRCIDLWSNPGATVLSPFAGIGSEGYQAVKMGRKFIGIELKKSYWNVACQNLLAAEQETGELF